MPHRPVAVLVTLVSLALCGWGSASFARNWALNGPAEEPPIAADRGVILGTIEETVRTLGIISNAPQVQFMIKEPIAGLLTKDGLPKTNFHFDFDDHELASAPPGDYALKSVHWSSEMVTWVIGAWERPEPVGTFKLAAGEVIYIGHLVLEPGNKIFGPSEDNKLLKMRVEDRFEEYRRELPPHLRDVVQKRLIVLPPEMEFPNSKRVRVR
jgi:hypothetical protein